MAAEACDEGRGRRTVTATPTDGRFGTDCAAPLLLLLLASDAPAATAGVAAASEESSLLMPLNQRAAEWAVEADRGRAAAVRMT